ncbi:hypothetical protein V6N11_054407 [Hibiscus sabdariffa]|uniref:Uncharacterized protein n=1 Tax=Hibiscus sabdariffa TaxID=183260 RepID=A0ABR2S3S8_9ROSI
MSKPGPNFVLQSHTRPIQFIKFSVLDKLYLLLGGDDDVVKFWDVAGESMVLNLIGHKDYVVDDSRSVLEVNQGKPVEDMIYLLSGRLIATVGGNVVKIWDLIGGGRMVHSMESHNNCYIDLCRKKLGRKIVGRG